MKEVLVVDLDGTLLKSDMLHESFWSALGRNWRSPFVSAVALGKGKAALKDYLRSVSEVDVSTLPYDAEVVAYIKACRQQGRRVALVTATNEKLAESIADHLQIFDEVHGSGGTNNLKGTNKAAFLRERFGDGAFEYMGDAYADLPVWEVSKRIATVNASSSLRRKVEDLGKPTEHLVTTERSFRPYINALRPHQWLKNILIFLPMLAAHQIDLSIFLISLLAFVSFSLVASSVYVLNDLLDLAADRAHPRKRLRPFASGSVPISHGLWMIVGLLMAGSLLAISVSASFLLMTVLYCILTTAYSLYLKRQIAVDICSLSALYTIRILAGGIATGLFPSFWLLAFSIFFFLSLAAVKRQAELVDMGRRGALTAEGRGYQLEDLPVISMVGLAAGYVSILVLAFYLNSPAVLELYSHPEVLWAVCIIFLYWITRVVIITHRGGMHDDPLVFAVGDRVSQICAILILCLIVLSAGQ